MKKSDKSVNVLVVISDTHCGCRLGLCPDNGVKLDDGGNYSPGPTQKFIWSHWRKFWGDFVPRETKGERFAVIHNGDAVEGTPHHAKTPISHNEIDQFNIATKCLEPIVDKCKGLYFQIRGTEAHVAKSATSEEYLAKRLGAVQNDEGQYSSWELWKNCGPGVVHFSHHIGVTQSAHHEASAVNAELSKMITDAARFEQAIPDIVVRSHRHQYSEVILPANRSAMGQYAHQQRLRSLVTPCWQGKTPFGHKVARGRPPQFGGVVIRWSGREIYAVAYVASFTNVKIV